MRDSLKLLSLLILLMSVCSGCDDSDDEIFVVAADLKGGWIGIVELSPGGPEGLVNVSLQEMGESLSGSWVWELEPGGEVSRGDVSVVFDGGNVEFVFRKDDPCDGDLVGRGVGDSRLIQLEVSGLDCGTERRFTIWIARPGVPIPGCDAQCGSGPDPRPRPVTTVEHLARENFCHLPSITPPFPPEPDILFQRDNELFFRISQFGTTTSYDSILQTIVIESGSCLEFTGIVPSNLRNVSKFVGGVAGAELLGVDGFYADVLRDYSIYLAAVEAERLSISAIEAIDQIVGDHIRNEGNYSNGLTFPFVVYPDLRPAADRFFTQLMSVITFHELGHILGRHALLRLRAEAGLIPNTLLYTSAAEDAGDRISGYLCARTGVDLNLAFQAYDILTFIGLFGFGATSMAEVISPSIQNNSPVAAYSTPARRKQLFSSAYMEMQLQLGESAKLAPLGPRRFNVSMAIQPGFEITAKDAERLPMCGTCYELHEIALGHK